MFILEKIKEFFNMKKGNVYVLTQSYVTKYHAKCKVFLFTSKKLMKQAYNEIQCPNGFKYPKDTVIHYCTCEVYKINSDLNELRKYIAESSQKVLDAKKETAQIDEDLANFNSEEIKIKAKPSFFR